VSGDDVYDFTLTFARMGKKVHITTSSLEYGAWTHGKTLCKRTGKLWRMTAPERFTYDDVCQNCRARVPINKEKQ